MSHTYVIVDLANMYSRARYITKGDVDQKVRLALSITLSSIRKAWNDFGADHVVVCLEGRSWRKDFYKPYKANRSDAKADFTPEQKEEDDLFWQTLNDFQDFLNEKTNCTVLQHPELEADDLIAGWIQTHPSDSHIIISTDSDFVQLIADNVSQYNGVTETLTKSDGVYDIKGKPVFDKKTGKPKPAPDTKWLLFEKCIRGDKTDYVFSAYPGVRKKGTKNKTGLLEAFADKDEKGFAWNNLMLQRWTDHNGEEHRVLDDYNRNVTLIDLSAQPSDIREKIQETVNSVQAKQVSQVGIRLMKFCATWDLETVTDQVESYSKLLSNPFPGEHNGTN